MFLARSKYTLKMSHNEFVKYMPTQTLTSKARISLNSLIIFDYEINFLFIYVATLKLNKVNKSTFELYKVMFILLFFSLFIYCLK